jgi:hypothetical protein
MSQGGAENASQATSHSGLYFAACGRQITFLLKAYPRDGAQSMSRIMQTESQPVLGQPCLKCNAFKICSKVQAAILVRN